MTPEQIQTLKTAILADPVLASYPQGSDGAYAIAALLNQTVTPSFVVWDSELTPQKARSAIVKSATQLDNLNVGKRDALLYLVSDTLDCRDVAVQQALNDLCGIQNQLKAALLAVQKRSATLVEKILATGTGSNASPATMGFVGNISYQDVQQARES